jgi:hypothetical protein
MLNQKNSNIFLIDSQPQINYKFISDFGKNRAKRYCHKARLWKSGSINKDKKGGLNSPRGDWF